MMLKSCDVCPLALAPFFRDPISGFGQGEGARGELWEMIPFQPFFGEVVVGINQGPLAGLPVERGGLVHLGGNLLVWG